MGIRWEEVENVVAVLVEGRTFSTTNEAEVVEVVAISQVLRAAKTTPSMDTEEVPLLLDI